MSGLIRLMLPLVAYLCVATVVSAGIAYGYLRSSGRLDDETVFRITALLQGVDLAEIEKAGQKTTAIETPAEEASFAEQQALLQTATLHFDAKEKQLADSLNQFDHQLKQLSEATKRYDDLKNGVDSYLNEKRDEVVAEARLKVRTQIEVMDPKKQAKPLLIKMILAGQLDEVILLLNSMKPTAQKEILKKFDSPEDIDMMFRLQQRMLAGAPAKPYIDAQLEELKKLNEQDK